jgi:aspartate racemase
MIGILGAMGPQAGIDLASKIVAHTVVQSDQDHIPLVLYSDPRIPDRTAFLIDPSETNPAVAMSHHVQKMALTGVQYVGVACNTAHAPPIFEPFRASVAEASPNITLLNIIQETVTGILRHYPHVRRVGILGSRGTYEFRLYDDLLLKHDLVPIRPEETEKVVAAIYDKACGIKSFSSPVSQQARGWVLEAIDSVAGQGAEAVILGCTELPLAVPESSRNGIPLIDPAVMLARALITASAPDRLAPWSVL